jgi:hypothetical protein
MEKMQPQRDFMIKETSSVENLLQICKEIVSMFYD